MTPTATSEHRVARPAPPLQTLVRRYIGYRYSGLGPGRHLGLPSPDLTLVISLGPATELAVMPDPRHPARAFDALIGGLHCRPAVLAHGGDLFGIELDLTPAGARTLLGLPAGELGGIVVSLDEVVGRSAAEIVDQVRRGGTWKLRFETLDRLLSSRLSQGPHAGSELENAWRLIVSSGGAVSVSRVAEAVGWSRRHLYQSFLSEYGVSPKQLARIARFHLSKRMLQRAPASNLAELAAACGYCDQSHLTREWNRLAGCAPSAWRRTDQIPFVQDGEGTALAALEP